MKSKLSPITHYVLRIAALIALLPAAGLSPSACAQGTAFTYQGRLTANGTPVNGNYEFEFVLFPTNQFGSPVGPVLFTNTIVTNSLFTVTLGFGAGIFTGTNYWLDVFVRTNGAASFTELTPRQPITPSPYAIFANTASNLSGTLPSAQLSGLYSGVVTFGNAADTFDGTYFGDGSNLTGLNASHLSTGTLPDARLSANVARLNANQTFTGQNAFATNVGIGNPLPQYPLDVIAPQAVARFTTTNDLNGSVIELNNLGVAYQYFGAINFNNISNTTPGQIGYVGNPTNADYDLMVFRVGQNVGFELQGDPRGLQTPSVIGGFWANAVAEPGSGGDVIAGGGYASGPNYMGSNTSGAFIGAGSANQVGPYVNDSVIAGGYGSTNLSWDSVIGGGFGNLIKVNSPYSVIGGGDGNVASGSSASTVSGGSANTASGAAATVGGGVGNVASGTSSTVSGGNGNIASGAAATVGGGVGNVASGDYSFAAGKDANAKNDGAFVWADDNNFIFSSTTANQFRVRATGGVAFVTAIDTSGGVTAGVHLLAGDTAWSSISDRNAKKNFRPVDTEAVLEKLAAIPVQQWNYRWEAETNTPHFGPMAQDFKAAFYPGRDDKSISTLEFDGVELAAIQGLNEKLNEKDARINALEQELAGLKIAVKKLSAAMMDRDEANARPRDFTQ